VEPVPPTTLVGERLRADGEITRTESVALETMPAYAALICTGVVPVTGKVLTAKVAVVAPAAIVTVAGTLATAALLVERVAVTGYPTDALSRSVAVEAFPPPTMVGLRDTVTARMASEAVRVVPA
jgi:hypothetical protein